MRSSGSHSVRFEGVAVAADSLQDAFPLGRPCRAWLERYLTSGLCHAAVALGVAEAAHAAALDLDDDRRTRKAADSRAVSSAAESSVQLAAMRSVLAAAANRVDSHRAATEAGDIPPLDDLVETFAATQRAKAFVDRAAIDVVDRALELAGGAAYLNTSPLARAWRDVRAGAFMHPYGANRGWSIIGSIELGAEPALG
jgi:alkylation response protein AidB-like acyl-CoA dehydrogenase